jgi:hypothetical protein
MIAMAAFRLVVLLLFAAAADMHAPAMAGSAEIFEESEEALHRHRPKPQRTVHATNAAVRLIVTDALRRPIAPVRSSRPVAARCLLRKIPPASSESSSAPEDQS